MKTPSPSQLHYLDAINAAIVSDSEDDQYIAAKARGLLRGYDTRWNSAPWVTLETEKPFHIPVVNPKTGKQSFTWTRAGVYDVDAEFDGGRYLVEHKTCSEDIADPNASYWRRLVIDAQDSGYTLAKWQEGEKVRGVLYDVIRKPSIRPKQIPKLDENGIKIVLDAEGNRVTNKDGKTWRQTGDEEKGFVLQARLETPEEFEERLAQDCIDRPDWYFQRKVIPRMDNEVFEYAEELWDIGQAMLEARNKNHHYRNSGACMTYGTPCRFLSLCSGHDSLESDKWRKKEKIHREIDLEFVDGGSGVLSHSRIQSFQTCRRKHYYEFEIGIEPNDQEEKEALRFGTIVHIGLRAWWDQFKEEDQCYGSANELPANAVGSDADAIAQV